MSRTPSSRARYKHKRAIKRFEQGIRTQPVGELKLPEPKGKKK